MEKKINELNNLYQSALDMVESVCNVLNSKNFDYKLGFYNNHEIKFKNQFIKEIYPIPVVSLKINKFEIDIGFDVATDIDYIGFSEFTLDKKDILDFDFNALKNFQFEIYGFENYLEDYYFGDIIKTKQLISQSKETKFHIGVNIASLDQIEDLLKALEDI